MTSHEIPLVTVTRASEDGSDSCAFSLKSHASAQNGDEFTATTTYEGINTCTPKISSDLESQSWEDNRILSKGPQGWRARLKWPAWGVTAVLLVNTLFSVVMASTRPSQLGIGTLYEGACSTVNAWSVFLHILINALSSILLCGSNYCMQCLAAPTRKEIDAAHSKGRWVDIGVPSYRNVLGRISWKRSSTWWILAITNIPIHFVYNSAVFKTARANHYGVVLADQRFVDGHSFRSDFEFWQNGTNTSTTYEDLAAFQPFASNVSSSGLPRIEHLTFDRCVDEYDEQFLQGRGPLIVVTTGTRLNASNASFYGYRHVEGYQKYGEPYQWMCYWTDKTWSTEEHCDSSRYKDEASHWRMQYKFHSRAANRSALGFPSEMIGLPIQYCLSMKIPETCKLQFSMQIMVTVVLCNAIKSVAVLWTLLAGNDDGIITIGDAIASYLERPDHGAMEHYGMSVSDLSSTRYMMLPDGESQRIKRRWYCSTTRLRWNIPICLCLSGLAIGSWVLTSAVRGFGRYNGANALDRGFGRLDPQAMLNLGSKMSMVGVSGLIRTVLVVNLPQVICTFLYFTYNSLLTSMFVAAEWKGYYFKKKPLRVSKPKPPQRSTYFLSLPFRYCVPLIIANGTLHWLISQSIFLARISDIEYGPDGTLISDGSAETRSQIGFSCLAMLLAIILGLIMILFLLALGSRSLGRHMPIVGSCSLAIAAACLRPDEDTNAAYLPVSWGEVLDSQGNRSGHCCFTSMKVRAPLTGPVKPED